MARTDRATRVIAASPNEIFEALTDADALLQWLPPTGMTGRFERFDASPGGGYRLVLTYDEASTTVGKSAPGADVVDVRFVDLVPAERVVQAVVFDSGDPRFAGTMTMTWHLRSVDGGVQVEVLADDVPDGITAADHAAGMQSSLENLAGYLSENPR